MLPTKLPKYRCQRSKNRDRAFIVLEGKRHYLGTFGSPESYEEYHRLLARWRENPNTSDQPSTRLTIQSLTAQFLSHANIYYRKPTGERTSEYANFKTLIQLLTSSYGNLAVESFGPRVLKALRLQMILKGWCRTNINNQINRIRSIFKWAVAEELVPIVIYQTLQAIAPLKRGRTEATESHPIKPAPLEDILAIQPYVSRQVWNLIQLQLLTGARAGELVSLTGNQIDQEGSVWKFSPTLHKTTHHGKDRIIYFGPQAKCLLMQFLPRSGPLFSPKEAIQEAAAKCPTHRRPDQKPNPKRTSRTVANHYTTASYRRAIHRACIKAGVSPWSPHQLRHNAATNYRRHFGIETARLLLGHESLITTEIYAEADSTKAMEAVRTLG